MEEVVGAWEARRKFGQILEEAFYKKDAFVVERAGRPMAAIVSIRIDEPYLSQAGKRFF